MEYIIQNDLLRVAVNSKGAEIASVINKQTGQEMVWQANPEVWNRHAPILFPYCGQLKDGEFIKDGTTYKGAQHGFARDLEHAFVQKTDTELVMCLEANALTMEKFPYAFKLTSTFTLENETLHHKITVLNDSDEEMPFGFGYHPGFVCPFSSSNNVADYDIVFDTPETPVVIDCDINTGLVTGKTEIYFEDKTTIPMSDNLFDNGSICFSQLKSKTVSLVERNTNKKITLNIENFPYVLIWSTSGPMQFMCIEPWHTLPDTNTASGQWAEKQPNITLAPEEQWETSLAMSFAR